jgi:hypothetical protein
MAATEILPWHRRHAVMLASQLPEAAADAVIVLRLTMELVEGFLAGDDKPPAAKVLTLARVRD